jgi:hypothetical protein
MEGKQDEMRQPEASEIDHKIIDSDFGIGIIHHEGKKIDRSFPSIYTICQLPKLIQPHFASNLVKIYMVASRLLLVRPYELTDSSKENKKQFQRCKTITQEKVWIILVFG